MSNMDILAAIILVVFLIVAWGWVLEGSITSSLKREMTEAKGELEKVIEDCSKLAMRKTTQEILAESEKSQQIITDFHGGRRRDQGGIRKL